MSSSGCRRRRGGRHSPYLEEPASCADEGMRSHSIRHRGFVAALSWPLDPASALAAISGASSR
jgi:hypothetical protein